MTRDIKRVGLLAAACGLALLAMGSLGHGEVSRTREATPRAAPEEITLVPAEDTALRTQCWQYGVKIIDQDGLRGLAIQESLKQQGLTFRGDSTQAQTLIVPFADGMCMVQPGS